MSRDSINAQQAARPLHLRAGTTLKADVNWILPLVWDAYVTERSPRDPQRFWRKMSQLAQFGLSDGGAPLLHPSTTR